MKLYRLVAVGAVLLIVAGMSLLGGTTLAQEDQPDPLGEPPTFLLSFYEAWINSPHADFEDRAFQHWNEDGEIEVECAACHSTPGYLDYLGVDGSDFGTVEAPAPLGSVVNCDACHNGVASSLTSVTFPSGLAATNMGDSAACMVCHQGRASTVQVNNAIEEAGLTDEPNTVSEDLGFINIHFYAAAASLYGSEVEGGYQFAGNTYQPRYFHVEGYQTCDDCHAPHSLELKIEECADCHEDVEDVEDLREIRMVGSLIDYDGDGDIDEGIYEELETLQEMLYEALQNYASEVVGTPLAYNGGSYPYFFVDTDGDGEAGEGEANYGNRYTAFTPVLLQASYNYQVAQKDPGGYTHNPKYHIELLYDSIEALNEQMEQVVDLTEANRNDPGHFDATDRAFRHWDEDGEVSGRCTKCHTAEGLPFFIDNGVNIAMEPSNSFTCTTCHVDLVDFEIFEQDSVTFPSGAELSYGEGDPSNICMNCHMGRESNTTLRAALARAGVGADEVSDALSFRNIHYLPAAALTFGGEAAGAYQFDGKEYTGQFVHARRVDTCADCHEVHALEVEFDLCLDCHEDAESFESIRFTPEGVEPVDYDGDGDLDEPIADEIASFKALLLPAVYAYAADVVEAPIVYNPARHPYWFNDLNGNGAADPDEASRDNAYSSWTPTLLIGAFNYQYVSKAPAAYVHNPDYIMQIIFDTVELLEGEEGVAGLTRPAVTMASSE